MVVTKMKQVKIKCRECDCWFLTFGIKKKIRGYKTLIHTFTKRIEHKTKNSNNKNNNNNNSNNNNNHKNKNNNQTKAKKALNRRTQSREKIKKHPIALLINIF